MTKLPACTGKQVLRALERAGFILVSIRGPHHYLHHPSRPDLPPRISVPVHAGKTMKRGTLQGILQDAKLSREEFLKLL